MYQWLHLWLLWFDSSFVVYRFGVPLCRLKFSMGFNMWVSWHLGRRKAERCRGVSDMWATTARLIDSEFRKLGAYPIRRHISTGESAPNFSISLSQWPCQFLDKISHISFLRLRFHCFQVLPISADTQHYTLYTEKTTCLCKILTYWKRNQPQPPDETTRWTQIRHKISDQMDENW